MWFGVWRKNILKLTIVDKMCKRTQKFVWQRAEMIQQS